MLGSFRFTIPPRSPADTAVPLLVRPLAANGEVLIEFPVGCETGAVVAISSTAATLTISANAALMFANFKA